MEREEQDAIDTYIRRQEMRETLENQIKGKVKQTNVDAP